MIKIYGLLDANDKIFYVGSTSNPLNKRKSNHIIAAKKERRSQTHLVINLHGTLKRQIQIIQLEKCKPDQRLVKEKGWIQKLMEEGQPLTNNLLTNKKQLTANLDKHKINRIITDIIVCGLPISQKTIDVWDAEETVTIVNGKK